MSAHENANASSFWRGKRFYIAVLLFFNLFINLRNVAPAPAFLVRYPFTWGANNGQQQSAPFLRSLHIPLSGTYSNLEQLFQCITSYNILWSLWLVLPYMAAITSAPEPLPGEGIKTVTFQCSIGSPFHNHTRDFRQLGNVS